MSNFLSINSSKNNEICVRSFAPKILISIHPWIFNLIFDAKIQLFHWILLQVLAWKFKYLIGLTFNKNLILGQKLGYCSVCDTGRRNVLTWSCWKGWACNSQMSLLVQSYWSFNEASKITFAKSWGVSRRPRPRARRPPIRNPLRARIFAPKRTATALALMVISVAM